MKFPLKSKIEKCVSTEATRYWMNDPWIVRDSLGNEGMGVKMGLTGTLRATDGHVLVSVPVELGHEDTDGAVPLEAIATMRKLAPKKATEYPIALNGDARVYDGPAFPRSDRKPPSFDSILKANDGQAFTINVKLLMNLAAAMGTDCLTITLPTPNDKGVIDAPVEVEPWSQGCTHVIGARGMIMPISGD